MLGIKEFDVIVIGAGPGGCAAAYDLAKAGRSVLLLDRRTFPRVKACAGAVTVKAVKALRYSIKPVVRDVATNFAAGKGTDHTEVFRGDRPICAMTVRSELDQFCLERTIEAGAQFTSVSRWTDISQSAERVTVSTEGGSLSARFLIGADGSDSQVRRWCGGHPWTANGLAVEINYMRPPYRVEMEFDFGVVDGGYGWVFPKGDHVNVGLYTYKPNVPLPRAMLDDYCKAKVGTQPLDHVIGQRVGLGGAGYRPMNDRIFLVGDAAGLTDALLGEGIYNAIRSGQEAAAAILVELSGGQKACAEYARRLAPIQKDVAECQRAATRFYKNVDVGYAALTSRVVRYALMKGYSMGMTFSATRKWFFVLPFLRARPVKNLSEPRGGSLKVAF